ncbi:acyl-CoA dehydrogenase family protein [Rhodococcus gannanensis]|uniref:Acyl-CoA dehydrogenase family protein n=1 Tax=Rhodococcus gannanensis TaxID=1960308 RepID=A0ABW4P0L7_9NOCA
MTHWPELAHDIAEDVLFPAADSVDADGEIPSSHFYALADAGFYGLAAPPELGGPTIDIADLVAVVETLCGGCLATTFTWMQHHGVVGGLAASGNTALRERFWDGLLSGSVRGGVAFAGAIPQPPLLYARRVDGGYVLDGVAPFVTGWGIVDVLQLSARDEFDDSIVHLLVDATETAGLTVDELPLIAARGSNTVRMRIDGLEARDDQVVGVVAPEVFAAGQTFGSWLNGCMATGVARRCRAELTGLGVDTHALDLTSVSVRDGLDAALAGDDTDLFEARAAASELALRSAAALVTATGSAASVTGTTAGRLMREATLTLVAASRPQIRSELLNRFGGPTGMR